MGGQIVDEKKFVFIDVFEQINDENMIETEFKVLKFLRELSIHYNCFIIKRDKRTIYASPWKNTLLTTYDAS